MARFAGAGAPSLRNAQSAAKEFALMDIDEEFDSLCLPREKKSLAREARAKIGWGDDRKKVQNWLVDNGIAHSTARRIVAIAVRQRATAIRLKGVWNLVAGIPAGVSAAAVLAVIIAKPDLLGFSSGDQRGIFGFSCVALAFGVCLTLLGVGRVIGGSRVQGAVDDVDYLGDGTD